MGFFFSAVDAKRLRLGQANVTALRFLFFFAILNEHVLVFELPLHVKSGGKKKKHSAEAKFFIHLFYLVCVVWVGCLQVLRTRTFLLPNFDLFVRIETTHSFSLVPPSLLYTRWRHSKCAFGTRLMRDYLGRKSSISAWYI